MLAAMSRWPGVLLAVALVGCGAGGATAPSSQPGVVDLPGGGKRVTLTGNYVVGFEGEGWNLATGRITPGPDDADFRLTASMVVSLSQTTPMGGFCLKQPAPGAPAFARVEEVPGDVASCVSWTGANLGGNSNHTESQWAGQAFLVRDRASVPAAKLLMFADYVMDGDVWVTFDIIGL
jgi:hypothetical protein